MTTKRTPIRRNLRTRITPETVDLWVRLCAIQEAGGDEEFEPVGRRREYLDGSRELDRVLGVKIWEPSPLEVDDPEPPEYMRPHAFKVESWSRAWELRQELEAASRQ